jgi:hypothetical protein
LSFLAFGAPLRYATALVSPGSAALVGLWLAARSEDEIFESDGVLGGVGFARSARVICGVTLALTILAVGLMIIWE